MVYHIMKDGSVVEDITGRVVPVEDNEALYDFIHTLNRNGFGKHKTKNTYEKEKNEVAV